MRSRYNIGRWVALSLLWLALGVACGRAQAPPGPATEQPVSVAFAAEAQPPPAESTGTATARPLPVSSDIPGAIAGGIKRSDFVVTAPTQAAAPYPTPTLPPPPTPTVPLPSPTTTVLAQERLSPAECSFAGQFVADVTVLDDAEMAPGTPFVKTWRLRNSGSCDWDAPAQLVFVAGDRLDGPLSVVVPPTRSGDTVDVSVPLTAPQQAGTYAGFWELSASDGQTFPPRLFLRFVVPSPATPTTASQPEPVPGEAALSRRVLLNYFAWYDGDGWDDCNISAGDKPLQPYHSDDSAAIASHVRMALDAGADGFTQQWYTSGGRTDRNFETLLAQSQGTGFQSTVVFLRHIWPGSPAPTQANVTEAVRYILERYASHPNFLKLGDKPVLFFTDLYRVPVAAGQTPQQAWAAIRAQIDPGGNAWWIAEGLDPSYLTVFDGLWVYKITHAVAPQAYRKAAQWANSVRQWEAETGKRKLWIGTLTPGWDDLRAGCRSDARVPSGVHQQERAGGAFYRATFDAALGSDPDWLWINSFNEWVEGSYVEPSAQYGDLYLKLTRELAAQFKGQ